MGHSSQPTQRLETNSNNQTFPSAIRLLRIQVMCTCCGIHVGIGENWSRRKLRCHRIDPLHMLDLCIRIILSSLSQTLFWIAGVGASMVVLPGPSHGYYQIENTKHCINAKIKSYVSAAFIVPVLFDACVFFAISYKILMFHRTKKPTNWKAFCCGEALPRISQAILQGGQQYYMITTGVNVTRSILAILPNVSPVLQLSPVPAVDKRDGMSCLSESQVGGNAKKPKLES